MTTKSHSFGRNPQRGSALLASMIVVVILTFAAAGVLSYSLTTYRNSVRQALIDQAKEVADSEMEYLYFSWKHQLLTGTATSNVDSILQSYPSSAPASVCAPAWNLSTNLTPFASNLSGIWNVSRYLKFNPVEGTPDGGATGLVAGTFQTGKNYYFTAKTRATYTSPTNLFGTVEFHSGRHFEYSSTSLFQFAVFYQGDLEIAAGGNMVITGPISTNASAYMGSQSGYNLTLTDKAYFFENYNGASDPLSGETDRLQGSGALTDPVYNPNPQAAAPTNQTAQRAEQVSKLLSQSSFIGGIDVASAIANYPLAYTNPQGAVDPNEVYRAVIAPPPTTPGTTTLIPEDPVVQSSRMYNRAGIVITVNQASSAATPTVTIGTSANPTLYYGGSSPVFTDAQVAAIIPGQNTALVAGTIRQPVVNKRELANGTTSINMTTLDVGALNSALTTAIPASSTLHTNYNGLVYVYDSSINNNVGSVTGIAPGTQSAILIKNAATTPAQNDTAGNPLGFSVASNNGVYIQGDYNTTPITVAGTSVTNPSAIMGDAVIAVSAGWNPANAGAAITSRVATGNMTVNAAILTGNTPSTTAYNSGGVQNLVRMEEDWWTPQLTLTLNGSLGQLFVSDYFNGRYLGNSYQSSISDKVYIQPAVRNVDFDANFKQRTPAGTPTTTNFTKGDFFFW